MPHEKNRTCSITGHNVDTAAKVNILLVDDTPSNLVALSALLSRPEYNLVTARSGNEALSLVLRDEFALILLDVMMPEMDGFEVASLLKGSSRTKYIPIIFVTAIARDVKDIFKGYSLGGVDYIQKPLEPDIVRAKVAFFAQMFLQKQEIQRQAEIIRKSERAQYLEKEHAARLRAEEAEKRYYDLINWVDHAVLWEYDPILRKFAFVSMRSLEILGYSPKNWTDDPNFFINRVFPEDQKSFEDMIENAIIKGVDGRCEHRFFRSDGETLWVHSGVNPRKDKQGKVTLLWGLTLDISNFKIAEFNQRFLAQASAVLNSSLDYATTLNKVTRLIVPELADWCVVDLAVPGDVPIRIAVAYSFPQKEEWAKAIHTKYPLKQGPKSLVFRVLETGEPVVIHSVPDSFLVAVSRDEEHLRLLRESGITSLMIIPLKARSEVIGAISLVSNNKLRLFSDKDAQFAQSLAWHMAIAIQNSRLFEEAKKAIKLREDLIGIVSHDLKNPLTVIRANAQLILRTDKIDHSKLSQRIDQAASKMTSLIADLLDLGKIEAGEIRLEKDLLVAQQLFSELLESVAEAAEKKSITIEKDLPEDPVAFDGDHDRILQVLLNLVGNAIKFTPEKGTIRIGAFASASSEEVTVWISDSGPGIPPEEIPHIFDRYKQTETGMKHKGGTGLGLYIAKKMIEAHKGRIWIDSTHRLGCKVVFSLPSVDKEKAQQAGAA